jgi:hypothetical protein
MIDQAMSETSIRSRTARPLRRRHWWRWTLGAVSLVLVLVAVGLVGVIKAAPTPSGLVLPTAPARTAVGPLDGAWQVAPGSAAGFRVPETTLGISNDTVGRTSAVTGTASISGSQVNPATFRIDLTTVKVSGKTQPQFAKSLNTLHHPIASLTLTRPVTLSSGFAGGGTVTAIAVGALAMNGVSHAVTFTLSARRDGAGLQAAGSIPVAFSDWGIQGPRGYGFIGSLANHGFAEFLVVLHRP